MAEFIEREAAIQIVKIARENYLDAVFLLRGHPAADVRPERHGVWVRVSDDDQDEGWYFCSECKEKYFNPAGDDYYMLPNFCLNCGAKMDRKDSK